MTARSADDRTRLSLYQRWAACARYWRDERAERKWQRKITDFKAGVVEKERPAAIGLATPDDWTESEDFVLIQGILAGDSYQVIANNLGRGRTRNACLSRARRRGWTRPELIERGVKISTIHKEIGA